MGDLHAHERFDWGPEGLLGPKRRFGRQRGASVRHDGERRAGRLGCYTSGMSSRGAGAAAVRPGIADIAVVAAVWAVTVAVFGPVASFEFLHYDDNAYITENPRVLEGLSGRAFETAFLMGHNSSWQPLAILSHMADITLFGRDAGKHHLVNLLFHLANTALLYGLVLRLGGWRTGAVLVAGLFALHPLHVEPVAWISSRKDVLSGFFLFLTLFAYLGYVGKPNAARYTLAGVLFVLGFLSKPMLVTLPFVLLLLDYWPLNRIHDRRAVRRVVVEKLPLFALSALGIIATLYFQNQGGAVKSVEAYPWPARLTGSILAYGGHLAKTVWPHAMAPYYPHPGADAPLVPVLASAAALGAITAAALLTAKSRPYLAVGWLWFVGMLLPVSGLVQFGSHLGADRYTYLPHVGLFMAIVWLVQDLASPSPALQRAAAVAGLAVVGAFSLVSARQVMYWRNDATLFAHAIEVTRPTPLAHTKLGFGLQAQGRLDEALEHFEAALELDPKYIYALNNLAAAHAAKGEARKAREYLERALEADPTNPKALAGMAQLAFDEGNFAEAERLAGQALVREPYDVGARFVLGRIRANEARFVEAIEHYRAALVLAPEDPATLINLGNAIARQGRPAEAVPYLEKAVRIDPTRATAHLNLASALLLLRDRDGALRHVREALKLDPDLAPARLMLEELTTENTANP